GGRPSGILLEFEAQALNEGAKVMPLVGILGPPDLLEQLPKGADPMGVAGQHGDQPVLGGRKPYLISAFQHRAKTQVDADRPAADDGRRLADRLRTAKDW